MKILEEIKYLINNEELTNEELVRENLKLLEMLHARLSLLSLIDWKSLEINEIKLYESVSGIPYSTWGNWNRLLNDLNKAKKKTLNNSDFKIENIQNLFIITDFFSQRIKSESQNTFEPILKFFNLKQDKLKVSDIMEFAIRIRNTISHSYPDKEWYKEVKEFLILISKFFIDEIKSINIIENYPEPWFILEDESIFQFNRMEGKDNLEYVCYGKKLYITNKTLNEFSKSILNLLGQKEHSQESLKKILIKSLPEEKKGVIIGDYLVTKPVAEGGFAYLHQGINLNTGVKVAIKILKNMDDKNFRERFQYEAETLSALNHENIVRILDYGEKVWSVPKGVELKDENWYKDFKNTNLKNYIVMEWVDGLTLDELFKFEQIKKYISYQEIFKNLDQISLIKNNEEELSKYFENFAIAPKENEILLANWFKKCALALHNVHQQKLIHRDIKPGNIMINSNLEVKIMDFGIAKGFQEDFTRLTKTGLTIGTPAYMSPEQIEAENKLMEIGPATDIYSLGATFYEMFTKSRIYEHNTTSIQEVTKYKQAGIMPVSPRQKVKALDKQLNEILMGTLRSEIKSRYQDMLLLASDIDRYLNNEPITYKRPKALEVLRLMYKRNKKTFDVAMVSLIMIISGTILAFYNINQQKNIAEERRIEAEEKRLESEMKSYAYQSLNLSEEKPVDSTVYALYSSKLNKSTNVSMQFDALNKVLPNLHEINVFKGHKDRINSITFSPDSKYIASGGGDYFGNKDYSLRLWDLKGNQIKVFNNHRKESIESISFSKDGKYIVSGSDKIILFDLLNKKNITFNEESSMIKDLTFSPDDKYIVGAFSNIINFFNLNGKKIKSFIANYSGMINSIDISPNNKYIVSGGSNRGEKNSFLKIWDLNGKKITDFNGYQSFIESVAFSPNGKYIITGSRLDVDSKKEFILGLWNSNGNQIKTFNGHEDTVKTVKFSPDSNHIISGSDDKTLRLWDLQGNQIKVFRGHNDKIRSVAFSPNGKYIASGSNDKTIRLWEFKIKNNDLFKGHKSDISSVAFSPDGKYIASGSYDNTIKLWGLNGNKIVTFNGHEDIVNSVVFSPDGKYIVSGSRDKTIKLWNLNGSLIRTFKGHEHNIISVLFSPDGKYIASGSYDNTIRLWDLQGNQIKIFNLKKENVITSISFSTDGKYIAYTSSHPSFIKLLDMNGNQIKVFHQEQDSLTSISFNINGEYLASGGQEKELKIFDLNGNIIKTFNEHEGFVNSVSFSPDGNYIASGGEDKKVRLWDLNGNKIATFNGHGGNINSISFSPDGKYIISGGGNFLKGYDLDFSLRLWKTHKGLVHEACEKLKNHSVFTNPQTIEEKGAKEYCQEYVWSKEDK